MKSPRVMMSLTALLLFLPAVGFVAQDARAPQRGVRTGPPRPVAPPPAQADPRVCKEQLDEVLGAFDREDPCTMTEERLREVAIEFDRVKAGVCRSGVGSIESTVSVLRYPRNRKCQFKVTGQSLPDWVERLGRDSTPASNMSPSVQQALFTHATGSSSSSANEGLRAQVGGVAVLTISSIRADLARLMKGVFARNGIRYVPIAEQTIDTVEIACGDQSDRASFHCAKLDVVGADGTDVQPVQFKDNPFLYRDQFGLQQGVMIFRGTYRAELLADGFTVNYGSARGTAHTLRVSAADAANILLLGAGR